MLTLGVLNAGLAKSTFLYDFHGDLYRAGQAIVTGQNPYQSAFLEHQAALKRASRPARTVLAVPVYPPPVLEAVVPLALLPFRVAGVLFTLVSIGGLLAGLCLLGVRDWRCFGVALTSWPVLHGLALGQMGPLLVFGAGLAWRYRAHVGALALSIAGVVSAKLFPWPLGVWLLVTKRYRAAALAAAFAIIGTASAWALIGFAGMTEYPRMLANLDVLFEGAGVSLVAALRAVGFSATAAHLAALAGAAALLGAAVLVRRRPDGDQRAMGLAVVAALVGSPIVWPHYYTLAFVPIALVSPRLSLAWCIPLLAFLAPTELTIGHRWMILPYLAIMALLVILLCAPAPSAPGLRRALQGGGQS